MLSYAISLITDFYGDKRAKRSGVPLLNHVKEGAFLLNGLGAPEACIVAFILHPMFQPDSDLSKNFHILANLDSLVVACILEYRNIANASLSKMVYRDYSRDWAPLSLKRPIKLSPLGGVNQMLVADKVQNYKDFLKYHRGTHERSDELEFYFNEWFRALGIDNRLSDLSAYLSLYDEKKVW